MLTNFMVQFQHQEKNLINKFQMKQFWVKKKWLECIFLCVYSAGVVRIWVFWPWGPGLKLAMVNLELSGRWLVKINMGRWSQSPSSLGSAWRPYCRLTKTMRVKLGWSNCYEAIDHCAGMKLQVIVTKSLSLLALFNYWSCQILHHRPAQKL